MREMINTYVSRLEGPNHPLLGPTLWGLQSWGMWQPKTGPSRIIYNLIHVAAILFVFSQYIELWFIRTNLELALRNLSVTMLSSVCVVKAGTFVMWQKYWRDLIQFVSTLETGQLKKQDKTTNKIIEGYIKYSRNVTYFYWTLVTTTVFTVILAPLGVFMSSAKQRELMLNGTIPYPEIMSSWVPFDKTKSFGYWFQIVEHSIICFYGGGIVANFDSNTVALMSFFCGQLDLLVANCKRLFGENYELVSNSEAMENIKQCHLHHLSLIKYSKILNSLLSPVMFLYVVICSLMICASAILLTKESTTAMQRLWVAEYLVALIAQLFLYCWHANEVYFMSQKVDVGVYQSEWWQYGAKMRRCILLLGGQLRRTIVFEAGPFTTLTVGTFVAALFFTVFLGTLYYLATSFILKGSYSYYTLLSNNEG